MEAAAPSRCRCRVPSGPVPDGEHVDHFCEFDMHCQSISLRCLG